MKFTELINGGQGQELTPILAAAFQSSAAQTSLPLQITRKRAEYVVRLAPKEAVPKVRR
jgi:hypothetical protein